MNIKIKQKFKFELNFLQKYIYLNSNEFCAKLKIWNDSTLQEPTLSSTIAWKISKSDAENQGDGEFED